MLVHTALLTLAYGIRESFSDSSMTNMTSEVVEESMWTDEAPAGATSIMTSRFGETFLAHDADKHLPHLCGAIALMLLISLATLYVAVEMRRRARVRTRAKISQAVQNKRNSIASVRSRNSSQVGDVILNIDFDNMPFAAEMASLFPFLKQAPIEGEAGALLTVQDVSADEVSEDAPVEKHVLVDPKQALQERDLPQDSPISFSAQTPLKPPVYNENDISR